MQEVRPVFGTAGCSNVATYIQSGNVIFDADGEATLGRTVDAVSALIGTQAKIMFRSVEELSAIVEGRPFEGYLEDRHLKLYVVFLAAAPPVPPTLPVVDAKQALELIAVRGREAYVVSRPRTSRMYGFQTTSSKRCSASRRRRATGAR
jgi:uncharacterized protein (DUF1697 family)